MSTLPVRRSSMDDLLNRMTAQEGELVKKIDVSSDEDESVLSLREDAKKIGTVVIGGACFVSQTTAVLGATSAQAAPIGIGVAAGLKAAEGPSKEKYVESVDSGMLDRSLEISKRKYEQSVNWVDRKCMIL